MRLTQVAKLRTALAILAAVAMAAVSPVHGVEAKLRNDGDMPSPVIATPDEMHAIVSAVVEHMKFEGAPLPPPGLGEPPRLAPKPILVVVDRSLCFAVATKPDCGWESTEDLLIPELDAVAPREFRAELVAANQEPHLLDLEGIPHTKVARSSDIERISAKGWWRDFYNQFPDSAGLARISQPVLAKDRMQALIFVAHYCGGLCGTGTILLLNRTGTDWQVIKKQMLWIS